MSYIHNFCKCEKCNTEFKYTWLYSDSLFEEVPDKGKYVFANSTKVYNKYEVNVKCPICNSTISFEYSLDGAFMRKL